MSEGPVQTLNDRNHRKHSYNANCNAKDGKHRTQFMLAHRFQRHVAGVTARRVGIGGQAVNHRAVGEAHFQLLDHRALEERGLARPGDDAARLDVLVHLLHQQARLPLALREQDPGRAPFQALEHGADGGRKGEAGLPALHHNLERRIVLDPAPLVGQKLEGRPLSFVLCHLLVLSFQFSVVSCQ